jgi:RimJ/RimL family protein N-acetyltransferase
MSEVYHIAADACVLRPFRPGDEDDVQRQADNPAVARNLRDSFPSPYTRADAEAWVGLASKHAPPTGLAITVDGVVVGGIGLELREDVDRVSAEVGYWLGEGFWGRGLATAALRAFAPWALETHGLQRLEALVFAANPASARVLEKAGWAREGLLRKRMIKHGVVMDAALYALVRED